MESVSALDHLSDWPADNVSGGWIDQAGTARRSGHSNRVFPVASLTKPLFSLAVLVAVEEGSLELDQPAGPPGSTIRHLLSHASGLGPDPGEPLAAPAQRRIYSNHGFDVLGQELHRGSGLDAATYFHEAVAYPLGMTNTALGPSPARSATSTVNDLLLFLAELRQPRLVDPQTMAEATTPQFPSLGGVLPGFGRQEPNPWGLGFELRGAKSPHWTSQLNSPTTFGHFGQTGTMLWVDPAADRAAVALSDRPFGPWAAEAWPHFSTAVLQKD